MIVFRRTPCQTLLSAGYTDTTTENGVSGLKRYGQQSVDLVIIDLIMPEKEDTEPIIELRRLYPM